MLTTAFIMLIGVFFDVGVWYYCKDLVIFNPQQKQKLFNLEDLDEEDSGPKTDLDDDPLNKLKEQYASSLSIAKDSVFMNSGPLTSN